MYLTTRCLIRKTKYPDIYDYCKSHCMKAKNLYNATLFRLRNHFTAFGKDSLTDHEKEVESEVNRLGQNVDSVLSYYQLDKIFRLTHNTDFFSGLPSQTAQHVVKQVCFDFKSWLNALRDYKSHPEKYTGRPKMPKYCKSDMKPLTITNQEARIYVNKHGKCELHLPLIKERFPIADVSPDSKLKEVKILPYYENFLLILTLEVSISLCQTNMPYMAGIDFGVDNIASVVTNESSTLLYKGSALKSESQWFNKQKAKLTERITKGHTYKSVHSHRLTSLSMHRDMFMRDNMHKISRSIVDFCTEHHIGTIVLGVNRYWKQNSDMSKKNNQNFVSIPFETLRKMIEYKCLMRGINIVEQEESYTSKADLTSDDCIPVYRHENDNPVFSGKRLHRGLYRCADNTLINADINAGGNILRKAYPDAFKDITDWSFLQNPTVIKFKDLNPIKSIPVKRIEAA